MAGGRDEHRPILRRPSASDHRTRDNALAFHHAGDLRLDIDCGDTGGQVALHELSIDRITREPALDQKVCLDRSYYRWNIDLNWPAGGLIAFAASTSR